MAGMLLAVPAGGWAHSGRTNAEGCHNNRKTGDYHCHGAKRTSAPAQRGYSGGGEVYFRNCSAARAAGYSHIRRGEPGYRRALDRDNDGIACE